MTRCKVYDLHFDNLRRTRSHPSNKAGHSAQYYMSSNSNNAKAARAPKIAQPRDSDRAAKALPVFEPFMK